MSQTHEESITCPGCGQTVPFTAYDTLNRAFDPEAADKLMNGNFFEVRCPHCGTVSNPLYSMLYHDPENITLIWYSYSREFLTNSAAVLESLREQVPAVAELAAGYRLRIVDDPLVLAEKALIFKHELDDRLIEIYKLRVEASLRAQYPEADITRVLFDADANTFLCFTSDGRLNLPFDPTVYETLAAEFANLTDDIEINREWAEKTVNSD